VVKFLVENKDKRYAEVGRLLLKDRQVIWATYKRASKKLTDKFEDDQEEGIPVSKLQSDTLSIFEQFYLIRGTHTIIFDINKISNLSTFDFEISISPTRDKNTSLSTRKATRKMIED